ncbi:hypothetical protein L2E82_25444 [Cichorium intybus]|uniref:Uncharacterized protein n=1 Tax=Cichorium intybus TaxID=13427 RepID=A0ACB9E3K8_CICIN|nr:hypothetical protein L2E82_25444 [Cichorium intybus]
MISDFVSSTVGFIIRKLVNDFKLGKQMITHHCVSLHTNRFEFKLEIAQNPLPLFPLGFFYNRLPKSPLKLLQIITTVLLINALITSSFLL